MRRADMDRKKMATELLGIAKEMTAGREAKSVSAGEVGGALREVVGQLEMLDPEKAARTLQKAIRSPGLDRGLQSEMVDLRNQCVRLGKERKRWEEDAEDLAARAFSAMNVAESRGA